ALSTPVPARVMIASRALTPAILAVVLFVVVVVIGRLAYGVRLPGSTVPACAIGVAVGAVSFCCLAFAVSSFISSEDSAQPVIQATVLPLYFISGVFVPNSQLSKTLREIASVFPISHLDRALFKAFDPATKGAGISARDLGLRLTRRSAGELAYRPRVQFPFLIMLWHNLNGERMTIKFDEAPAGGTRVAISGAVARRNHALAADPEHWSEPLGATAAHEA